MTFGISHLDYGTLLSSGMVEGKRLVCFAREYVRNSLKQNPYLALSFYKSRKGRLHELNGPCRERDTNSYSSFSAFLCTALSVKETTRVEMEPMFFDAMLLHKHDPRGKTGVVLINRIARNKWRQQHLVRPANKFLASTAPVSIAGLCIGQNIIQTARVMQKHTSQGSVLS